MSGAPKEGGGDGGGGKKGGGSSGPKVVDSVSISSADRDLIRGLMDMDVSTAAAAPPPPADDVIGDEIATADGSGARAKHQEQSKK